MENFLSKFANTNTEVTSNNANLSVSPEFYGTIDITKGALTMKIHFYARVYKMRYENCIALDDWEINDRSNISFGGMPIDNIELLKKTMTDSGLTTIAKGLDISDAELKKEICIQLEQLKMFKDIFGKKARMFTALSDADKKKVMIKFAIDKYEIMTPNNEEVKDLVTIDDDGVKSIPTIETLKEVYNNLKTN
jgi:hypothetical protein